MFFRKDPKIKRSLFRKIVNGFIYFGIGVLIAFMVLFAVSQTSSFRDWLREKVVTTVNGSINGELSIESIDGTIFTALILNNSTIMQAGDTLFFAEKIEVRTSPLELLFKTIYFRKLEISNANITFLKDENGELNISKLAKSSNEATESDSSSTDFTFKIKIADLSLINVDFSNQSFEKRYSNEVYDTLNMNDIRVNDINLSVNAFANLQDKEIRLSINSLSVKPNLNGFKLKNISGDILIKDDEVFVNGLNLKTLRSNISLDVSAKNFPLFGGKIQINKVPFQLRMVSNDFNFDDLTNFIPAIELLQGKLKTDISARGTLDNLNIQNLDIALNSTRLQGSGNVKNVLDGAQMFIDVNLSDSYFHPADPDSILRTIDIPVYDGYGTLKFDTLYFKGEPLNFNAGIVVKTVRGDFDAVVSMDLTKEDMVYDINLVTQNLDLAPVINLSSSLNSHIVLKGEGTSPDRMNTDLSMVANWSEIQNRNYQKLNMIVSVADADVNYNIFFNADSSSGKLYGEIDYRILDNPVYKINTDFTKINLEDLIPGSGIYSNLNMNISAQGNGFDPDSLEMFAVFDIDSSTISDIKLDNKKLIVDLRNDFMGGRVINVVSNLADITLSGKFSVVDIASLIEAETNLITDFIDHNIKKINPGKNVLFIDDKKEFNLPEKSVDINYSIEFKDFELLSLFLGNIDMEVDGEINGLFKRNGNTLTLSVLLDVNYFKYLDSGILYFISGMNLNTNMINDFSKDFPASFNSNMHLSAHELFLKQKIHDLNFNASLNHETVTFNINGELEDFLTTELNGNITLDENLANLYLDSLFIKYNDFSLWNKDRINITYSDEQFVFNNFVLTHDPGEIELNGLFSLTNDENLSLHLRNLPGGDISREVFGISSETGIKSDVDLTAFWQGTAQQPLLNLNFTADKIIVKKRKIGTLITTLDYDQKGLNVDLNLLDTLYNIDSPKLRINGILPIDLALQESEQREFGKEVSLSLEANQFELITLSGILPLIKNLKGELNGGILVDGSAEDLNFSGNAALKDVSFTAKPNNISYELFANVLLDNDNVLIDSIYVKNIDGTKDGGTISGKGKIKHNNLKFSDVLFTVNGQLKILGTETRSINPAIYGDLSVKTRDDIIYVYNDNENSLNANLIITKGAEVTFSPQRSAFTNSADKLVYKYKDYSELMSDDALIDSLIVISNMISQSEGKQPSNKNSLKFKLKIDVEDEAKMVFVLSPEFKQNLTAYLGGTFEYTIVDNKPIARGELSLLEGSKLEFIKPFDALGTVKFFEELDNPYLDVTATYQDYYILSDSSGVTNNEKEVEIRIRLEGPLSQLNKNFIQQEENISVYIRDNNLVDYQLDATKTSSDAIMFIIVGKFTDDATSQDRNFAASTAASFAGSLVGGFLNEKFGDYVRSVRFQQVGSETRVSLIGKAGPVRYEIGGTSQVFQDLSRANVKIEYPPITTLRNLILRFQRREPLQGTTTYSEMINEFGVKYKFDF